MKIYDFVDEGLGHSSYVIDLGDGTAAIVDPPRFPNRTERRCRLARVAARLDLGHAFARRLRDGQPGARRPDGCDVHRSGRFSARVTAPTGQRRRTRRARRGSRSGRVGDARAHTRPPRLSPRRARRTGRAVHRRFADGRHGRANRPVRSGPRRAAGPRDVPLAAPLRRVARRSRRVPDARRRVVLLGTRRRRAHHHARPRTCHQPTVRRSPTRTCSSNGCWPGSVPSPPTSPGCPS